MTAGGGAGQVSWVANVMIDLCRRLGLQNVEALSDWPRDQAPLGHQADALGVGSLRLITGPGNAWGGGKNPECELWVGALNHADLDALRQRFAATPWQQPNAVQLLIIGPGRVVLTGCDDPARRAATVRAA